MRLTVALLLSLGIIGVASAAPLSSISREARDVAQAQEKLLRRGLKYVASQLAAAQDDDEAIMEDEDLADVEDDDDMVELQSRFWRKALKHGLRYASGLFGKQQDDNDKKNESNDLAKIERLMAKLQDGDMDDDVNEENLVGDVVRSFFANEQDDDDDDMAELQSRFWRKALKHGLKYASGLFGKEQDDNNENTDRAEIEDYGLADKEDSTPAARQSKKLQALLAKLVAAK